MDPLKRTGARLLVTDADRNDVSGQKSVGKGRLIRQPEKKT